jgi:2-iminoacetate synthase
MNDVIPEDIAPTRWLALARPPHEAAARAALQAESPGIAGFAALLSVNDASLLEAMARRAQSLTARHFGKTISLYVPLYLSDYCASGCVYCGFASDRPRPRCRLNPDEIEAELSELRTMGLEEVLLLTGERTPEADLVYLRQAVTMAAGRFHNVTVEAFAMSTDEYRQLAAAGATGITIYQETYDPVRYEALHRWGPKRNYADRLDAPSRAFEAGLRTVGIGVLLGLADPVFDALCLFRHAERLRKTFWQGGISVSFPRVCPQEGDFTPPFPVSETELARMIFAFRICFPDVPLVLSTRESPRFRDGMAGVGISKMSVASRTTVGGYHDSIPREHGQFLVNDPRDVETFCRMLRSRGLEPVFKNWDAVYR